MSHQDLKLGSIIDTPQSRDAIHVAVAPVFAQETLFPGQHIGLVKGSVTYVTSTTAPIGIVDPYLKHQVTKGQQFWMFLYPQTVTGLRHDWTHPAFTGTPREPALAADPLDKHRARIHAIAEDIGIRYQEMMDGAKDYLEGGNYLCDGGRWEGGVDLYDFWDHYEAVTGTKVKEENRGSFFTCSC